MSSIVESLTTYQARAGRERVGHLIEQLEARCAAGGHDYGITRVVYGPYRHRVTVRNPRSGEAVEAHAGTLTDALDQVLDELNRREEDLS